MRSDRPEDEPFLLVSPKLAQVFLVDMPKSKTWQLVVGANARGRNVVYHEEDNDVATVCRCRK